MYSKPMRQSVGFAGEIGRVQRPSKRVRSEVDVRHSGASDFQIYPPGTEQESLQQPSSMIEEAGIQQPERDMQEFNLDLPFMNGPSRNFDGDNHGLAIFITGEMVMVFKRIMDSQELIAVGTQAIKDAEEGIRNIQLRISRVEGDLDDDQRREERCHICAELAELREDLGLAEERVREYKKELELDESDLGHAREELEGCFSKVLGAAGLFGYLNTDFRNRDEQAEAPTRDMEVSGYIWPPQYVEQTLPSPEELRLQAAQENLDRSLGDLMDVQFRFNKRHQHYMQAIAEYQLLLEMGEIDHTLTEFGLRDIKRVQHLTRELITAEETYKAAKVHAKELGLPQFDLYQSSDFVDRDDDGYRESEEVEGIIGVDRGRIERWQSAVGNAGLAYMISPKGTELTEIDGWDAKPVGIDDSASAVDVDRYWNKIDLWAKHCSELRQQLANQAQTEDVWTPHASLLGERRRSC
ncbi:hypothetical protein N7G274_002590 [Stereocaulon virgatum]|uniref:Uncharacterized protein n=1 Tax=Stereocaulon virgatum TaxID=373712 RepID=A0ABR4AH80_9LECA